MAGKLSFSIALNLLTENFKAGTNNVKNGLRSMQMQVLTFAAAVGAGGLGLEGFVSRLIETARETSKVTTALKNVSGGAGAFATNQKWLIGLANKYGLEINSLTGAFAKFTATASTAGMSMAEQTKLFEGVSRATTAFGLSSDEANGVFLALSQMMSKGKISAEELRGQMGERLPIAMQAMAKAAGTTVGGLDDLMKQGKLLSSEVLPKFADALNSMTPNVDTNNIETSINRLKNAFTEFTKGTGVQSAFKTLVDEVLGLVTYAGNNIKSITTQAAAFVVAFIISKARTMVIELSAQAAKLEMQSLRSNAVLVAAAQNRVAAELALESAKNNAIISGDGTVLNGKKAIAAAELNLQRARVAEETAMEDVRLANAKLVDQQKLVNAKTTAAKYVTIVRQRIVAEAELEAANANLSKASNEGEQIAAATRVSNAKRSLKKLEVAEAVANEAQILAATEASAVKSATAWGTAFGAIKVGAASVISSFKSLWSSYGPMVVITAVTSLIFKMVELADEAKKAASAFGDYKNRAEMVTHTGEIGKLKALQDIVNDTTRDIDIRKGALSKINETLGTSLTLENKSLKNQQAINKTIGERIALMEAAAKVDYYVQEKIKAEEEVNNIERKYGGIDKFQKEIEQNKNRGILNKFLLPVNQIDVDVLSWGSARDRKQDADRQIKKNMSLIPAKTLSPSVSLDDKKKEKETDLQRAEAKYAKDILELDTKLKLKMISEDEHKKAIDELNKSALVEAMSLKGNPAKGTKYLKDLQDKVANPTYNVAAKMNEASTNYNAEKGILDAKRAYGDTVMTQEEYDAALSDLIKSTRLLTIGINESGAKDSQLWKQLDADKKPAAPLTLDKRDSTFDYKKTASEIANEELDVAKSNLDKLKEYAKANALDLTEQINAGMKNVTDLSSALKIQQVKDDVKEFKKTLDSGIYGGVKDIASSADRMVSSFSNLSDVFSDVDSSGWERIMAVWSAMTNTVDGILSIISMIEKLTEVTNSLAGAKVKEAGIDTAVTGTKVANAVTGATASALSAGVEKTAATGVVAAKTGEAAASAGASAAKLPFPLNLIAIGGAIAGVYALFSGIAKFENGGIVGGSSYSGDKILTRLNSGEMVLNKGQQATMYSLLSSGNSGSGSTSSETRVRGCDLYLTLKNYMKSTGKKL